MEPKHSFLVGLTSLLGLFILAGLLMVFGEFDRLLTPSYAVEIRTDDAAGLRPGSAVTLNGVRVGQVDEVELGRGAGQGFPIRVVALIERGQTIPADTGFQIERPLLGGGSVLTLTGDLGSQQALPTDGTAMIEGSYRSIFDHVAEAIDERFAPLAEAMTAIGDLAGTLQTLAGDVGDLTAAQTPEELAGGAAPNLRTAVARMDGLIAQATDTLALAEGWLGDEALRQRTHELVGRVGTTLDEMAVTAQRYAKLADSLESDAERLLTDLRPVLDDVSLTLERMRQVATAATDGEGTVAQLLNNPDLYRSLDDAAIRLERVLVELQLLIQKIKAEGLPIDL